MSEAEAVTSSPDRDCGVTLESAAIKGKRWREENADALDAANADRKVHGLPLARERKF